MNFIKPVFLLTTVLSTFTFADVQFSGPVSPYLPSPEPEKPSLLGSAATGIAKTVHWGDVDIPTTELPVGKYHLWDQLRGNRVYDLNNATPNAKGHASSDDIDNALPYQGDTDNVWGDNEFYSLNNSTTSANGQTQAAEVLFNLTMASHMYDKVFNYKGIKDDDITDGVTAYVHLKKNSTEIAYYGILNNKHSIVITNDDWNSVYANAHSFVIGHEYFHALTRENIGFLKASPINEGLSDVFGLALAVYVDKFMDTQTLPTSLPTSINWNDPMFARGKFFALPSKHSYYEHNFKSGALNLFGTSDFWSWNPSKEMDDHTHKAGGMLEKAFYHLAEGVNMNWVDGQENPRYSYFLPVSGSFNGLGFDKAANIYFGAVRGPNKYFNPVDTDVVKAASPLIKYAANTYNKNDVVSTEARRVRDSFAAVNIGTTQETLDLYQAKKEKYPDLKFSFPNISAGTRTDGTRFDFVTKQFYEVSANNDWDTRVNIQSQGAHGFGHNWVGYLHNNTDVDYYKVIIPAGKTIQGHLISPRHTNFDLFVYNASKTEIHKSTKGKLYKDSYAITNVNNVPITAYLKVVKAAGQPNSTGFAKYDMKPYNLYVGIQ